ncbi:hypothetical protein [Niveibacterium terrae]|uniref:hypothetical protein n=1 Tax=Niveibacterium terrae TaxID=3373598 RepID=UPI003A8E10C2
MPSKFVLAALALVPHLWAAGLARAEVIAIEPGGKISLEDAARRAKDGDTISLAAGDFRGEVAVFAQSRLTIRGVAGKTRLLAMGRAAEGKGILVLRGQQVHVEGIEFRGARVPDRNGAGIRFELGSLTVRNCRFLDNENGILTAGNPGMTLTIENSEFGHNGAGDGQSHNLYVGAIDRLVVRGSYFHHAKVGHLLKSRARDNDIRYNRLTDEIGGRASYELEFPNGGRALVLGNLIEQSSTTENSKIVSYGAEGYRWPVNSLTLVFNTLVDDRARPGIMLDVRPGAVRLVAVNNLLVGLAPGFSRNLSGLVEGNHVAGLDVFANAIRDDYRLAHASPLLGKAQPVKLDGVTLSPDAEYVHPRTTRSLAAGQRSPGAFQTPAN